MSVGHRAWGFLVKKILQNLYKTTLLSIVIKLE